MTAMHATTSVAMSQDWWARLVSWILREMLDATQWRSDRKSSMNLSSALWTLTLDVPLNQITD